MKRSICSKLMQWKNDSNRRPLIVRGARQVGKTFTIQQFARTEFSDHVLLNFDKNPEYKEIFDSNEPKKILEKIELLAGKSVTPGKTLLFLDEIQECPKALSSLRYFYEEMQELHVIAAGSLLEFALHSENFRMPVGRIQYLYMYPLSFSEFLDALGEEKLRIYIGDRNNVVAMPKALEDKANDLVRKYFFLGGMPAVIQEYLLSGDIKKCQRIQGLIINTFLDDFAKYARIIKHKYLQKVFNAVPTIVGQKCIYTHIDPSMRSRNLQEALELLEMAGVVRRVKATSGAGLPLEASAKENYFKTLFLDIGLLHAINGIYKDTVLAKNLNSLFKGAVSEQFVGQELIAYSDPYFKCSLYYWVRDAANSKAEVDYIIEKNNLVIPVEVKSGAAGRMKSLHMFKEKYKAPYGVKISQDTYRNERGILSIPFYHIEGFIHSDYL